MCTLELPDMSSLLVRHGNDHGADCSDDSSGDRSGDDDRGGDTVGETSGDAAGVAERGRPAVKGANDTKQQNGASRTRGRSAWTPENIALLRHAHAQTPGAWKAIHQRYFADDFTYHQVKCKGAYLFYDRHRRRKRAKSTAEADIRCPPLAHAAGEPLTPAAPPPALLAYEPPPRRAVTTRGGRRHSQATTRRRHTRFTAPVAAGALRIPNVGPPVLTDGGGGRVSKRPRRHQFHCDTVRGARSLATVRPVNVAGMSISVYDAFMGDGADAARVSLVNSLQRTMCSLAVPALDYHHDRGDGCVDPRATVAPETGGPAQLGLLFSDWYLPPGDIDYLLGRLELHTAGGTVSVQSPPPTSLPPPPPPSPPRLPRRNHHRFRPATGPAPAVPPIEPSRPGARDARGDSGNGPGATATAGARIGRYTLRAPADARELRALLEHICIDYLPLPLRDDVFAAILTARSPQFAAHVPALAQSIVLSPEGNYVRVDIRQRLAETWARYVRWRDELWHTNLRAHMTMHVYLDSLRRTRRARGHTFRVLRCVKHVIDSLGLTYAGMRRLCGGRRRARIERIMRHIEHEEDGYGQYTCRHANAMFTAFVYDLIWGTLSVLHRVPAEEVVLVDALELMGMDDAIEYYLGGKTRRLYNDNRRRRRRRARTDNDGGSACSSSVYSGCSSNGDIGSVDDLWDDLWGSDSSDNDGGEGSVVALDPGDGASIDAWLAHSVPPPPRPESPPPPQPSPPPSPHSSPPDDPDDDWPDVDPRAIARVAGMSASELRGPLLADIFRAWAKSFVRRHREQLEFSSDDIYKDFCKFLSERCGVAGRITTNQRPWRELVGSVRAGRLEDMPLAAHPTIKRRFLAVRRGGAGDTK